MNVKTSINELRSLIDNFWFAPNDALLRSIELSLWRNIKFVHPVLEIGVGDGIMDKYLFKNKIIDFGIDIDKKGLLNAKSSKIHKNVLYMDASNMNFTDSKFNTVIANSTFEHIKYDIKAISEVARVLKKNGHFIFCVPTKRYREYLNNMGVSDNEFIIYNKRVAHYHYRSYNDWFNLLKKNNLKIIDHQYYFPYSVFKMWYRLHKIVVLKPYKRELWSYLKDSPYGKYFPQKIIKCFLKLILGKYYLNTLSEDGAWVFVIAKKI